MSFLLTDLVLVSCFASHTEKELQAEKERMYEAIGYSENAQVPIYPKEVFFTEVVPMAYY